ncbi:NADPH oxidase organizer 1a [Brachyhypopomus gauderio]|uniref:NADPH oxidase organizer 1a n=1 Tax=Brachyhypopomus gauderio TaxID=698409 RepID=UPI004040F65C
MEEKRYPVNIRLIGVMHKDTSKLYMTSVLWSDGNELIVYRKLEDFKTLHKQLKKKYESPNPFKNSERILPKFKAERVKNSAQAKRFSKSVLRLQALEEYCTALLSAHERVSSSAELAHFLIPRPDDLKPEFTQNSIVIMPSEDAQSTSATRGSDAGVTQPFVTETYRCIAPYETKDTKNRPFKVDMDETVDVLIKDKAGWWLVENESKCIAWFPAPYLEKADAADEDTDPADSESVLYVVTRSYKSTNTDELSVEIGTVAEVLQKSDNGWWLIRYNRKVGYVPTMYLQPYSNPRVHMNTGRPDFHGSSSFLASPQIEGHQLNHLFTHLQLPSSTLRPADKTKSRSAEVLRDPQSGLSAQWVLPTIEVQPSDQDGARSRTASVYSSEISSTDDSSSVPGDSFNGGVPEIRRCRTPTPMTTERLSPNSAGEGRLMGSISDPNLFKPSRMPKVPPRPQAQEILQRCTTVTRKNASKNQLSPQLEVMHSR